MSARPSRLLAWLALVTWLIGVGAPVAGAHAIVDIDCGDVALSTAAAAAPRLDIARPPVEHEHCLLCHFQRDLRSARTSGPVVATAFRILPSHVHVAPESPRELARVRTPSRAPPSVLS